jgi:L-asparaginase/Glu-tRNA(Gln) amidotransferase subunit D
MKRSFFLFLILISVVIIPIVLSASLSFDRAPANYNLLDMVYITGTGFTPNVWVSVQVNDSTGAAVWFNTTQANSTGGFTNIYIIPDNAKTGTYYVFANSMYEQTQNTFNVLADTEKPRWFSLQNIPSVVTILDDVKINVTWYDNIKLNKVLIWENLTGNWVSHNVGG